MKKQTKKQKIAIEKVYKAFAVASTIGAVIQTSHNGNPKLTAMLLQCNRAMRVFNAKLGRKTYREVSQTVNNVWKKVGEYHNTFVLEDEAEVVIEMLYNLLPKADMKAFLNLPFRTDIKVRDEAKSSILCMVMSVDEGINDAFGTKRTADRDKLGKILTKPIKIKKAKKKREKPMSKAQKRHIAEVERHKRRKQILRQIVADAKRRAMQNQNSQKLHKRSKA